jgi:N-acetyl sugar amidotransferase
MIYCKTCILDDTIPDIYFDSKGVCNYCNLHFKLESHFPLGQEGKQQFDLMIEEIKSKGKNKKYDCIIGVSGGTDSTYLTHIAKQYDLRPLAVNFDNGWHSEIAVSNILNSLKKLNVDLETYVVDYEEMKDLMLSYMRAGVPWIDGPTDIGIVSCLYRIALKEKINYIFVGNNFRIEGRQPEPWTFTDGEQLRYIHYIYGKVKLKSFPNLTSFDIIRYQILHGVKLIKPFYYLEYNKKDAMVLLEKEYDWRYYGGHHHESIFTRFAIAFWQYKKFGIDKRKITFSAMIRSGQMDRLSALEFLKNSPYDEKLMVEDKKYVIQKLDISLEEFDKIWNKPNKSTYDYPSMLPIYKRFNKLGNFLLSFGGSTRPMSTFGLDKGNK